MVTETRQTVRSALSEIVDGSLNSRIRQARTSMLMGHISTVSVFSCVFATAMCWLIYPLVNPMVIWPWLAAKWLILVPRIWHARAFAKTSDPDQAHWYHGFMLLLAMDGLLWGGVGWWLTPVAQLNLAAVTLACVVGIAATGSFMLHMDGRAAACLQLTVLGPNALYCLARHDQFGTFGAISLAGFAIVLQMETSRAQRRMSELLRLRFTLEKVAGEREDARAEAEHLSEAKSRFLATMSHEMRTPLSGILGLTRMLKDEEARPQVRRRLELVERSGEHLLTVLTEVLDFSKMAAGHLRIDQRSFDLGVLIDEVVGLSSVTARDKGLSLLVHSNLAACHPVVGDPMRVRQVLHNLIGNAIKFTDEGRVTVRIFRAPGAESVVFEVEDTGIGIPDQELSHIFDAFHQVDGVRRKRREGTGLGLTISRQLCQAMGGDLRCSSRVGHGSRFVCTLPLPVGQLLDDAAPAHSLAEGDSAWAARRVLLVEDNPINALVAEASLRQLGLEVLVVDDGCKAVDCLATQSVDLVLMDCIMPEMDGYEATRQIRGREAEQLRQRVPIVALTATADEPERQKCLAVGMDGFLSKPFSPEELQAVLARHLAPAAASEPDTSAAPLAPHAPTPLRDLQPRMA
ncbi:MAG: response regulator [Burkholderiales bacterium]|nr:response regulator [Burkholderiales bacterium]